MVEAKRSRKLLERQRQIAARRSEAVGYVWSGPLCRKKFMEKLSEGLRGKTVLNKIRLLKEK